MEVHILASGSSGNAALFRFGGTNILVDAGISARRIEKGLAEAGINAARLDALLITHEHRDHIKGLDVLVRKHSIPVYTRSATWVSIPCRNKLPGQCRVEIEKEFSIGDVGIEAINISHDAADPVGFCFFYKHIKAVMMTDLGLVTPQVEKALELADVMVLEANHDLNMLDHGPYPQFLKQRIKSSQGHLSNMNTGRLLARIQHRPAAKVFLAHLSQKNNHPDLAEKTVAGFLKNSGYSIGKDIFLNRTFPDQASHLVLSQA